MNIFKLSETLGLEDFPMDMSELPNKYDPEICKLEAIKRNSEMVICPNCGVKGNRPNMMRWHFENCKTVLKNCKQCDSVIPRQNIKDYLYKQKHYCNRNCYMESKKGKPPIEMTDSVREKISVARKLNHARKNISV